MSTQSASTLQRCIRYWLDRPPTLELDVEKIRSVICDGTFLEHRTGIYAVMDGVTHRLIKAAYDVPEGGSALTTVYSSLRDRGLWPRSATIDGNPQQMRYLRQVWPRIKLQRCTVHVQRQGLSWCRAHPKRTDVKHLREIFRHLSKVRTLTQARRFRAEVVAWEDRFGSAIDHSTDRGWVFSDLVRARSMLLKALPHLFYYVTDPLIPRSTNALESYFSRLKEHYRHHRGLAVHHRDAYFRWYFYLVR